MIIRVPQILAHDYDNIAVDMQNFVTSIHFLSVDVWIYQYNTYALTYWDQNEILFERGNIHFVKDKHLYPFIER